MTVDRNIWTIASRNFEYSQYFFGLKRSTLYSEPNVSDGGAPYSLFESGAILSYLAEKTGKFMPSNPRDRHVVMQWLFWQVSGLGPMTGQSNHFLHSAPEQIPYAIDRYHKETARLYGVLNGHMADGRDYIAGSEYSIADMACYPWIAAHYKQGQQMDAFPALQRWIERVSARPATQRAYALADQVIKKNSD